MRKEALKGEKIQQQVISVAPVPFLPHLLNDTFHQAGEALPILHTLHVQRCRISSSTGTVVHHQSIQLPSGDELASPPREAPSVQRGEKGSKLAA